MASVSTDSAGNRRILFLGLDSKRKTIYLGKAPSKNADYICRHVETLLTARMSGQSLARDTAAWIADIADSPLARKLAKLGMIETRKPAAIVTVGSLVDEYLKARSDVKKGTHINLDQAGRALVAYFGTQKLITEVTEADAEDFSRHLHSQVAHNTARRRCGRAKQFFGYAIKKRLLSANPFNGIKTATGGNTERQEYISVETIQAVIDAAPSAEWRLIIALSRFGGLRCPSEHLGLTWADVRWDTGRFTVRSPKTEHIEGKAERIVPIFPELRPYLEDAYKLACDAAGRTGEQQTHVITRNRCDSGMSNGITTNWRTQFERIIRKASVKQWPRLFHNLRLSCQTDLANRFPGHVVCEWLGNSMAVAREHYLQITEAHYLAATVPKPTQNPTQTAADRVAQARKTASDMRRFPWKMEKPLVSQWFLMTLRGFEPRSPP
jgi:integrase